MVREGRGLGERMDNFELVGTLYSALLQGSGMATFTAIANPNANVSDIFASHTVGIGGQDQAGNLIGIEGMGWKERERGIGKWERKRRGEGRETGVRVVGVELKLVGEYMLGTRQYRQRVD